MEKDSSHAHKWGSPWTDQMGIFLLTKQDQQLLWQACQNLNPELIKPTILWKQIDNYIQNNGTCFFKLSTASPKDIILDDGKGSSCKADSVERLFKALTRSFRIMEYLEDNDIDYAIVLTKWNDKIDFKNEYRCFVMDGICEAISHMDDCTDPSPEISNLINQYIYQHHPTFPETAVALDLCITNENEIIFIEFNPIDEELDSYGIIDRNVKISEKMYAMLQQPSKF